MEPIPRIEGVETVGLTQLLVTFENGVKKIYDCEPLFSKSQFRLLMTPAFFRAVRVDAGGYGVSWSDEIDLSEYELWTNGKTVADEALHSVDKASG